MAKYTRLFGAPADDPNFFRLQALVMESLNRLDGAHALWARYEEWIAHTPARWPGAMGNRARALILERMGRLARDFLEGAEEDDEELEFFDFFGPPRGRKARKPAKPKPLSPPADGVFPPGRRAGPGLGGPGDRVDAGVRGPAGPGDGTADDLLRRFPNDLGTLESAARLFEQYGETTRARDCLKRALSANPLDAGCGSGRLAVPE